MKFIIRNFAHVIKRFKTSSILNIVGLSAAIFIFLVLAIQIQYDLTFNSSIKNNENIFQVVKHQNTVSSETYNNMLAIKEIEAMTSKFPEIKTYCLMTRLVGNMKEPIKLISSSGEKVNYSEYSTIVSSGFKDIFNPEIAEGSLEQVFSEKNATMISSETAKRMFGKESPVGKEVLLKVYKVEITTDLDGEKSIDINGEAAPFIIKAVYKDFADNSSVNNGFITYQPTIEYLMYEEVFFEVDKGNIGALREKINTKEILDEISFHNVSPLAKEEVDVEKTNTVELLPIKNIHINYTDVSPKAKDKKSIYMFITIAILTLAIAYINFINFTTAMAPARVRALNIRMILGADKNSLRMVLCGEAVLFTLCALAIAIVMLFIFQDSTFVQIFSAKFSVLFNYKLLLQLGLCVCAIGFIIGIYPAFYITNFNAIVALKGTSVNTKNRSLRNILITIQLIAAISFIIIALFVSHQHSYMLTNTLGIDKNNVIVMNVAENNETLLTTDTKTFIEEVIKNPIIEAYTAGDEIIGKAGWSRSSFKDDKGNVYSSHNLQVAQNYLDFFGIEVLEGENLNSRAERERKASVINEQYILNNNVKKDSIGGILNNSYIKESNIIGVVRNFNYLPLTQNIGALQIYTEDINDLNLLYFRPTIGHVKEARQYLDQMAKKFSNKEIEVKFLDEHLEQSYAYQENLATVVTLLCIIIIIIAIMGIYGLITFNTKYRTKEIAIRKVNGAEIKDILYIINQGLLVQYILALFIAVPITYLVVDTWLEQFPFRINLSWWIFAIGGIIILLITLITVSAQSYKAAIKNPVDSLKSE